MRQWKANIIISVICWSISFVSGMFDSSPILGLIHIGFSIVGVVELVSVLDYYWNHRTYEFEW